MAVTTEEFARRLGEAGLLPPEEAEDARSELAGGPSDGRSFADELVRRERLTAYQAEVLCGERSGPLAFAGDYVVLDRLAEGGMGVVYKALHRGMKRVVAVKTVTAEQAARADAAERFRREVEVTAHLEHPNIVSALDAGEDESGLPFLVTQFVEGRDLSSLVKEHGPLAVPTALDLALQAARGLDYAHANGIVHRDVKPANLLLDPLGRLKVLDLGLAKDVREAGDGVADSESELTRAGELLGTVDYIAPEQALDTRQADRRSDVYSLGCTLYFLLTGRPAYEGDTAMKRLFAHRERAVPSLREARPETPAAVDDAVRRMMDKAPDRRPQSMAEVIALLEACVRGLGSGGPAAASMEATVVVSAENPGEYDTAAFRVSAAPPDASAGGAEPLARLVDALAVDGYLSAEEERDAFRKGVDLGLAVEQTETAIHLACRRGGATRETVLVGKLEALLAQAARPEAGVSPRAFEHAVRFAVRRGMPRKEADERLTTLMLDRGWKAREGLLNPWFRKKQSLHGLR